jgi:hypothetical protein
MCNKSKTIDQIEQERYMLSSNKKSDMLPWYQDTQVIDISDCEQVANYKHVGKQVCNKIKADRSNQEQVKR